MKWRESWAARDRAATKNRNDNTQILRSISGFLLCSQLRTDKWELRTAWKRHTGVLEGTPSSEAALRCAHESEDAGNGSGDAVL